MRRFDYVTTGWQASNDAVAHSPQCISTISYNAPLWKRIVHMCIYFGYTKQSGALCDTYLVHYGVCEMDILACMLSGIFDLRKNIPSTCAVNALRYHSRVLFNRCVIWCTPITAHQMVRSQAKMCTFSCILLLQFPCIKWVLYHICYSNCAFCLPLWLWSSWL